MLNSYGKYKNARNASWETIINYNINSLPVSVTTICKAENITLAKNSNVNMLKNNEFAKTFLVGENWYIIYDDTMQNSRIRFSVAHELGHIFLGHTLINNSYSRTFNINKPESETQADIYASRLLAPACVLHELGLSLPNEIAKICNISLSSAKIRADRLKILEQRNKWYSHPLEKQVYNQFKNYIANNKAE